MASSTKSSAGSQPFSSYQKLVVAILAFMQFTIVLDFMILSPLGAVLMPALQISPKQFGLVVSVYAFSAGLSGILAAGFADRFDRKRMLMFFYAGFVLGTLLCGIASSYEFLLFARMVTGLFGGVIGSIVLAIATDLFPLQMRGRVMGVVQTAFGASQILGLPLGLYLSNHYGWHAPFQMIVAVSVAVGFVVMAKLRPINEHVGKNKEDAFEHLVNTVTVPRYAAAFATTSLLAIGGYMLMPFTSAFTVHNMGIPSDQLFKIYLVTGVAAIVSGPIVGRAADSFGKLPVLVFGSVLAAIMVVIYTHLGVTPLPIVMLANVVLFVGIFSRMIPSQALMSAIPTPQSRGAFMAITASLQQMAGGVAALVAGYLVTKAPDESLLHVERVGYVMCCTVAISVFMMVRITRSIAHSEAAALAAASVE